MVLDPDSGELLASVSYPWPDVLEDPLAPSARRGELAVVRSESANDALLDRARYGLYPPGSTFKLVTASAALRQHVDPRRTTFTCARLPDGRVGARINGWNRPVRDDVMDTIRTGRSTCTTASCIRATRSSRSSPSSSDRGPCSTPPNRLGISLTPAADAAARVRQTLPQIGYGQGDVVVTPLRLARVSAAVASNGVLRDTRCEQDEGAGAATDRFLNGDDARVLAGYMRDVVLSGTGRVLRNHPGRIAGKTGTAQLDGRPSHGWFVGFAPFGPADQTNRVRRRHRERRLRRPQRGAGRRRNRRRGIACRPAGMS